MLVISLLPNINYKTESYTVKYILLKNVVFCELGTLTSIIFKIMRL